MGAFIIANGITDLEVKPTVFHDKHPSFRMRPKSKLKIPLGTLAKCWSTYNDNRGTNCHCSQEILPKGESEWHKIGIEFSQDLNIILGTQSPNLVDQRAFTFSLLPSSAGCNALLGSS